MSSTVAAVWAIDAGALPSRADLAWASSPCQDFSLAGRRAGLKGGRSSAFWGFWRLIEALDERFGVRLALADLTYDTADSPRQIAELVSSRQC